MGIHIGNPFPGSFQKECDKAASILRKFAIAQDSKYVIERPIPPAILQRAKGLAILTVAKIAFIGGARGGSGILIARLPNGDWSAPSAISQVGGGVGGQIGFELTDFVFVLNDAEAVNTLANAGSLTLGGNISLAAGPVGRNAEAAGAASTKGVAGIFAYSDTKGLFAGVSLEGSMIIERKDENKRFYDDQVSCQKLLKGVGYEFPSSKLIALAKILQDPVFKSVGGDETSSTSYGAHGGSATAAERSSHGQQVGAMAAATTSKPFRPAPPKPPHMQAGVKTPSPEVAVADFDFAPVQDGDLGFSKGDQITIVKRDENPDTVTWWTGQIDDRQGTFPSNYVKLKRRA